MTLPRDLIYLIPTCTTTGHVARSALARWRDEWLECERQHKEFIQQLGAVDAFRRPFRAPTQFRFAKHPPEGWRAPGYRGATQPRKTRDDLWTPIRALPNTTETPDELAARFGLPTGITWLDPESNIQTTRSFAGPSVWAWTPLWEADSVVVLRSNDYTAKYAELTGKGYHVDLLPKGAHQTNPAWFRRVSPEEVDCLLADAALAKSRGVAYVSAVKGRAAGVSAEWLTGMARAMLNIDAEALAKAGVLLPSYRGGPAKGGSDWDRFNRDFLTFILKLPEPRLQKLVELVNNLTPQHQDRTNG